MAKFSKHDKARITWDQGVRDKLKAIAELERKGDKLSLKEKLKIGKEKDFIEAGEVLRLHYEKEIKMLMGRVSPQAVELEEVVLGAIILESNRAKAFTEAFEKNEEGERIRVLKPIDDPEPLPIEVVKSFLRPEHFYSDANQIIYQTVLQMYEAKVPIDMRTVVNELRVNGNIGKVGEAYYISGLCSQVSSAANIEYHARVIVERAISRDLIKFGYNVMQDAYDDTANVFLLLDKNEKDLKEISKLHIKK